MERTREVPEIGNGYLRQRIVNGLDLVDEGVVTFLSTIPTGSKIIEIEGGMGEISEHLSELGNKVALIGEHRLFFVYREQVFPKSKVIPMNLNPDSIRAGAKAYYDCAIVHSTQYLTLAKSIAKTVYNVVSKEVATATADSKENKVEINDGKELVNSPEESVAIPENKGVENSIGESVATSDIVSVEQVTQPDSVENPVPSDNQSSGDLE